MGVRNTGRWFLRLLLLEVIVLEIKGEPPLNAGCSIFIYVKLGYA